MRVVIIHALPESIDPTKLAFNEIYPEAELITLFDEALFKDFSGELTPALNARMVELIFKVTPHAGPHLEDAVTAHPTPHLLNHGSRWSAAPPSPHTIAAP